MACGRGQAVAGVDGFALGLAARRPVRLARCAAGFRNGYAQPIWQALRAGKIAQLQIDILGAEGIRRVQLTRGDAWAFWRRSKRLAEYSIV